MPCVAILSCIICDIIHCYNFIRTNTKFMKRIFGTAEAVKHRAALNTLIFFLKSWRVSGISSMLEHSITLHVTCQKMDWNLSFVHPFTVLFLSLLWLYFFSSCPTKENCQWHKQIYLFPDYIKCSISAFLHQNQLLQALHLSLKCCALAYS